MEDEAKKDDTLRIGFDTITIIAAAIFSIAAIAFLSISFVPLIAAISLLLLWGSHYALKNKAHASEMCCMMSGMTFGMMAGFFIGAVAGLSTTDFVLSMIIGSAAGLLFGIPTGQTGGALGRMEGVMAGPMGGMMGAMTGIMVKFYNTQLFVLFLTLVVVFTVWEMSRLIKTESKKMGRMFLYIGVIISLFAVAAAASAFIVPAYAVQTQSSTQTVQPTQTASGEVQEVSIKISSAGYTPNKITLRKDVPVRMTLTADQSAGCARSVVFPEFNIRKTVPSGGSAVVEFTPTKAGTFPFSCSMNMFHGTVVVQ